DKLLAELNDMLGQQEVKSKIKVIFNDVVADRIRLRTIPGYIPQMPNLNFLFTGNPGTGKSTMARIIGRVLQRLGVFPSSKEDILTELNGSDLLTASPADIRKLFEDNIGRVVIIEEAYSLAQSPRVVTDIVANIDRPEYENKLAVIMAGYAQEMSELKKVNKGLPRRFKEIRFSDYSNEDLYEILVRKVNSSAVALMNADECRDLGIAYFASLPRDEGFGNAATAKKLFDILQSNKNKRFRRATPERYEDQDFALRILPCDFPNYGSASMVAPARANSPQSVSEPSDAEVFDGAIDCTENDEAFVVAKGSDIYSSVGLLETDRGMGTAFIISRRNRYIMTASHVIEGNSTFRYTLNLGDGLHQTEARLLWNNPVHDFAILQVDSLPADAKCFRFDTSTPREPATPLRIIAFPLGRQISNKAVLTSGSISNYEENLNIHNENGQRRRFNAIRTEAQATHGSSGGPVVLADTMRVVGVLHGGMNENGFFMNLASDISQ
ncbi:MAG: trypsin-like peptidase domain-containing protein, partial [Muribaculaceae bacterium]|nr:trypsin-like peptidase domain-containing protein [Muribaculaceae bacterium]